MQIREAIILAGGAGTRLRTEVPDLPKCMAPVAGKPFITYLLSYLVRQGITRFIFALGYKHEIVTSFLAAYYPSYNIYYSVEDRPLGTGGAIQRALGKSLSENILVLNGDTLFNADCNELASLHVGSNASCTLCLKPMHNSDRYGVVKLNNDHSVESFHEKQFFDYGLINGGIYALNKKAFQQEQRSEAFSFEKDYLEPKATKAVHGSGNEDQGTRYTSAPLFALIQDAYFIDIGIPEDYKRAQLELPLNIDPV